MEPVSVERIEQVRDIEQSLELYLLTGSGKALREASNKLIDLDWEINSETIDPYLEGEYEEQSSKTNPDKL